MGRMYNEQLINVAVDWWTEKITGLHKHDNGERSLNALLGMAMADYGMKAVTLEQEKTFREELKKSIMEYIDDCGDFCLGRGIFIGCDYGPCEVLAKAAEKAGINVLNFPFKTDMQITTYRVSVSDGYAQPWKIIFEARRDENAE